MSDAEIKAGFADAVAATRAAARKIDADARARDIEKSFQTPDADLTGIAPTPLPPGAKPDPAPHPREAVMETAGRELAVWLNEWVKRYELTAIEYLYLLGVTSQWQIRTLCLSERKQQAKP